MQQYEKAEVRSFHVDCPEGITQYRISVLRPGIRGQTVVEITLSDMSNLITLKNHIRAVLKSPGLDIIVPPFIISGFREIVKGPIYG